jgi:hypothetical protein
LVENSEDRIVEEGISAGEHYRETWTKEKSSVDGRDCIITENVAILNNEKYNSTTKFFLSNVLPNYEVHSTPTDTGRGWETRQSVKLLAGPSKTGYKSIVCGFDATGNVREVTGQGGQLARDCWAYIYLQPNTLESQNRVTRALDYIYTNFCTHSEYDKPY